MHEDVDDERRIDVDGLIHRLAGGRGQRDPVEHGDDDGEEVGDRLLRRASGDVEGRGHQGLEPIELRGVELDVAGVEVGDPQAVELDLLLGDGLSHGLLLLIEDVIDERRHQRLDLRNAGGVGQLLRPPLDRAIETVETLRGLHLDDRQHQVVAAGEVRVERAAGQAAGLADLLDRGAVDAAHGEDGDPGLDQGGSGLLSARAEGV